MLNHEGLQGELEEKPDSLRSLSIVLKRLRYHVLPYVKEVSLAEIVFVSTAISWIEPVIHLESFEGTRYFEMNWMHDSLQVLDDSDSEGVSPTFGEDEAMEDGRSLDAKQVENVDLYRFRGHQGYHIPPD